MISITTVKQYPSQEVTMLAALARLDGVGRLVFMHNGHTTIYEVSGDKKLLIHARRRLLAFLKQEIIKDIENYEANS